MTTQAQNSLENRSVVSALDALREHGFEGNSVLGAFICSKERCRCVVQVREGTFKRHLRKAPHNLKAAVYNGLWSQAKVVADSLFAENHAEREAYWRGGAASGVLVPLPGLSFVKVRECPECTLLVKTESAYGKHYKAKHSGISGTRRPWRLLPEKDAQEMSRKAGQENIFLVPPRSQVGAGTSSGATSAMTGSSRSELGQALLEYDPGQIVRVNEEDGMRSTSDREKSGFVRVTRADERLAAHGLTMEEAVQLTAAPSRDTEPVLCELLKPFEEATVGLYTEAHMRFQSTDVFTSVARDIATSGVVDNRKAFRFLEMSAAGDRTKARYARSARVILLIAIRVYFDRERYNGIGMSASLGMKVEQLMDCPVAEKERFAEAVHALYSEVFFEKAQSVASAMKVFASAVVSSLCVVKQERGGIRFRQGTEVSPFIVGILYTVSCCALLEMTGYGKEEQSEQERRAREAEISDALKVEAKVGLAVFRDIRAKCSMLRDEETNPPSYTVCTRHKKCGLFRGTEYSVPELGQAVKLMQSDVRRTIFSLLLFGKQLPVGFAAKCNSMADDTSQKQEGYWFVSDRRNEAFVQQCLAWLGNNVVGYLDSVSEKEWVEKAKDAHQVLLTLLHICGGGPGRGTEIASLTVRNTKMHRRSLYVVGEEVLIAPTYNKTCAVRGGKMRVVTRYLDRTTSYLLKSFFVLVHPVLVALMSKEWDGSSTGGEEASKKEKMYDDLCLFYGVEKRITQVISACFARYGIKFNFSDYRHWQRGYVKTASQMRVTAALLRAESDGDEDEHIAVAELEERAAIEQGGHSRRTAYAAYAGLAPVSDRSGVIGEQWNRLQQRASHEWHRDLGLEELPRYKTVESQIQSGSSASGGDHRPDVSKASSIGGHPEKGTMATRSAGFDEVRNAEWVGTHGEPSGCVGGIVSTKRAAANGYHALGALRRVLNDNSAMFRSSLQSSAMNAIAARDRDVALVLPTGFGKTAIVCGPILFESGVTLWISPLKALLAETRKRLEKAGLNVICFAEAEGTVCETGVGNVVLISPENVSRVETMNRTKRLGEAGKLNRIVIDEAHIPYMSSSYRECMRVLKSLGDVRGDVRTVLVTATAPEILLSRIARTCGVEEDGLEVIRGDPCRPNLSLEVEIVQGGHPNIVKAKAIVEVKRYMKGRKENKDVSSARVLIVCLTIAHADGTADLLRKGTYSEVKVCKYHSKMSASDVEESVGTWEKGEKHGVVVMVATDGFCTGTDVPNIRLVVFAGGCRSMVDYWQGAGRAGRDGMAAIVKVLYHRVHLERAMYERDEAFGSRELVGDFSKYAESSEICRRKRVEEFLEGLVQFGTCLQRKSSAENTAVQLCDVCSCGAGIGEKEQGPYRSVVQGNRRLSAGMVAMAKRRKLDKVEQVERERREVRRIGTALRKVCVGCLIQQLSASAENRGIVSVRQTVLQATSCRETCLFMRMRCLRCRQVGHRVGSCNVMENSRERGDGACYKCFVSTVDGRQIHVGSEYGNGAGGCPYEGVTRLVLICYSLPNMKGKMENRFPEVKSMSDREVADWLLKDGDGERPAAILKVAKWAIEVLEVKKFVTELENKKL